MNQKFLAFDSNRRDRLINEGFKEFSILGLERSSLNNILSQAKIPKGLFYHYFDDKQSFFVFLIEFSLNYITQALSDSTLLEERDYIKRLERSFVIKSEVYKKYGYFESFIAKVYKEENPESINKLIDPEIKKYGARVVTENIDFDMFLNPDHEANIRIVSRYLHQAFVDIIPAIRNMSKEQIEHHMLLEGKHLRKVLYKEEYI